MQHPYLTLRNAKVLSRSRKCISTDGRNHWLRMPAISLHVRRIVFLGTGICLSAN